MSGASSFDVAIVGYGPVGQVLANLLGAAGHRVVVVERWPRLYARPRAAHLDHEIHRVLDRFGALDELGDDIVAMRSYDWRGADGELILEIEADTLGVSGFPVGHLFYQPTLEAALHATVLARDTVTVLQGWDVRELHVEPGGVRLSAEQTRPAGSGAVAGTGRTRELTATYVVGADGANSMVRDAAGIELQDLGFAENWLVADVAFPGRPGIADWLYRSLGDSTQWCDPRRPHMSARVGRDHRRWEFMLLPGERAEDYADEGAVWAMLAPWVTPETAVLERHIVYRFSSKLAATMRTGPVLLVGDAAHVMPPFIGQGLCSGIRDAANLAWKLDLVLRGRCADPLLDSVTAERYGQNRDIIGVSLRMGRVSCTVDPAAAAARDAAFRTGDTPPPEPIPGLTAGLLHRPAGRDDPLAGTLGVQGLVAGERGSGLADAVTGPGFCLITLGDPAHALDHGARATLEELDARILAVGRGFPGAVADLDGRLTAWLTAAGAAGVLVRPDFYVFGSAATPADIPALVHDLATQLGLDDRSRPRHAAMAES